MGDRRGGKGFTRSLAISVLLAAAVVAGCGGDDEDRGDDTASSCPGDPIEGQAFQTNVPEGFESPGERDATEEPLLVTFLAEDSGDEFPANVSIAGTALPEGAEPTLEEAGEQFRTVLEGQGSNDVEELPDSELDGETTLGFTGTVEGPDGDLSQTSYGTIRNGTIYTLGATSLPGDAPAAEAALESVAGCWTWTD